VSTILVVIVVMPFVVGLVAWSSPPRLAGGLTVVAGIATFGLALTLVAGVGSHPVLALGSWLRADALSVVFLVATAFLYAVTSIFAIGYVHGPQREPREDLNGPRRLGGLNLIRFSTPAEPGTVLYTRRFWAGLNLFAWSMAVSPLVNSLALLWVAIEITTVISALLVAIDNTDGATEASWKYVLIASMGLGIALVATIVIYYAGSTVLGSGYELFFDPLLRAAHQFPPGVVRLAFVLAVLGYGTKMGLFPVHTWLPDAHSEAPTPVSALLSGSLLTIAFYAILRYYQIAIRAVGVVFPRQVLLAFGIGSLVLAALYLLRQRDLKRLFAYSSIEHMGILMIGMSFGVTIAVVGVLIHVLAHAAAKATAFFGAGSVMRRLGTKDMSKIRGGIGLLPWSGPMLVLAILGLSAAPPFGIFRSELLIVYGGLSDPQDVAAAILVALVTMAFFGLSWYGTQTMVTPTPEGAIRGETSGWIVAAMLVGLIALAVLGIHPPGQLDHLLTRAAAELGPAR
jgi:hydrogenase-4 component F